MSPILINREISRPLSSRRQPHNHNHSHSDHTALKSTTKPPTKSQGEPPPPPPSDYHHDSQDKTASLSQQSTIPPPAPSLSVPPASQPSSSSPPLLHREVRNRGEGEGDPTATPKQALLLDPSLLDDIISRLIGGRPGRQVHLLDSEIRQLCTAARDIFLQQPNLLDLEAPIKICGDIHGQYTDLLRIFEYGGFPPAANYLFLGDYVDYGKQSLETICLLLAFKIKFPANFFLLRGCHESADMNRINGFYDECKRRYNVRLWKVFTDCFNCLPAAAIIDDKILCMHGGISPHLTNLDQIRNLPRPTIVPDAGLLCDLLWSDPDIQIKGWEMNESRGVSYTFGYDRVVEFLDNHNLDLICRAHQVVEDGYEFFAKRGLVTIFSAPNYGGEYDNAGAVLNIDENLVCSFEILKPST